MAEKESLMKEGKFLWMDGLLLRLSVLLLLLLPPAFESLGLGSGVAGIASGEAATAWVGSSGVSC